MYNIKIGDLELRRGLILAPMAGVTDAAFRSVCGECGSESGTAGAELTFSEMISAAAVRFGNRKTLGLADMTGAACPTGIQIFGSDPQCMAEAARKLCGLAAPALIDINMGCPMRKIVSNGEGSALMRDIPLAGRIIGAVVQAVNVPVTVKMRRGWDDAHAFDCVGLAHAAQECGAAAVTVHGRTREQMYGGHVDYECIARTVDAVRIPVIGNGDVDSPESLDAMLAKTGCAAVMIGRGALGQPWLFAKLAAHIDGVPYVEPDWTARCDVIGRHLRAMYENMARQGLRRAAVPQMRKHAAWYLRGIPGAAELRERAYKAETLEELLGIINN